jgi:hypothetical protein
MECIETEHFCITTALSTPFLIIKPSVNQHNEHGIALVANRYDQELHHNCMAQL